MVDITASLDAATSQILALLGQLKLSNVRFLQAQDIGAADACSFAPTPGVSAYGPDLVLVADVAAPNKTTAPTLTIQGLTQIPIQAADGSAPAIGTVVGKQYFGFSSLAGGGFAARQLGPAPSALLAIVAASKLGLPYTVQVFSTAGTYTYTPTSTAVRLVEGEVQAGGGGGGGTIAPASGQVSIGQSGGGGAYLRKVLTSGFAGATVVVGAGGAAGTTPGGAGGNGGLSAFAGISAGGGTGGGGGTAVSTFPGEGTGVSGGATPTGGDFNKPGGYSLPPTFFSAGGGVAGQAGHSHMGFSGAAYGSNQPGGPGQGFGAGGTGGVAFAGSVAEPGGAGAGGCVIIKEFY